MDIPTLVKAYGGVITWTFRQGDFEIWRHHLSLGICSGLAVEWIKCHANDSSLASELRGGNLGPLNVARLKQVELLHATSSAGNSQTSTLETWLKTNSVVPLRRAGPSRTEYDRRDQPVNRGTHVDAGAVSTPGRCANIENDITHCLQRYNNCYARVNFTGTVFNFSAGHSTAVFLGQTTHGSVGDALFFDPNYGEFWFESKEDFFSFFPVFYRKAYRYFHKSFDDSWEVLPCAKRVID